MDKKIRKREKGSLTVEASLVLTFFIFVIMLFLSFGRVFRAQNYVSHALMQTTQAIAQDYYIMEKAQNVTRAGKFNNAILELLAGIEDITSITDINQQFLMQIHWSDANSGLEADAFRKYAKWTLGDDIDDTLKEMGIDAGLNGLEIQESSIEASGDVYVYVKYQVKLLFPYLGFKTVELEQKARAKIWK